ncbi:hypothetical protein BH20CHL6_BH20CHL6_00160 [soil metagenome]
MERSIATAGSPTAAADRWQGSAPAARRTGLEAVDPRWIGIALVAVALAVYVISNLERTSAGFYNHFVWQAEAFLDGRFAIAFPVSEGPVTNAHFQDVLPLPDEPGRALIPFPPLPAILLTPLVALFGLATNAGLIAAVLGAVNVGLAWRLSRRLTQRHAPAILATLFYAFGTVAWYAAMLGSTWFLAHVVASLFLFLALTAALDAERRRAASPQHYGDEPATLREALRPGADRARRIRSLFDARQFVAGLLLGTAAMARLPVIFGAPFFVLVGGGGRLHTRALSAGLGAIIPIALLFAYNFASTGSPFHPAYDYLYSTEFTPQPGGLLAQLMPPLADLQYRHGEWAIEDPRYIPQNAIIMLGWLPQLNPSCGLSLLDVECPLLRPDELSMSLFLTSPTYLLAFPLIAAALRRRLVLGAVLAVAAIALINVMHFSQGWVQFGYRFSNDFAPFALVLVTLAIARYGVRPLTIGLVAASILVNAWGVYWGVALGW